MRSKAGVLAVALLLAGSLAYAAEGSVSQAPVSLNQFIQENRGLQPKVAYLEYREYLRDFGVEAPQPTLRASQIRTESVSSTGSFDEFRDAHRGLNPKEAYRAYRK